ncbi:CC181 protein, partial [Xiphorhynchus elegans]|nr:CC181 protein [Xiphorhynchus elegans]
TRMSEKEDQGDAADTGDTAEVVEYEDDFEKDVEWLESEEEKENLGESEIPEETEEDTEAQILKAADSFEEVIEEMEENLDPLSEADANEKVRYSSEESLESRPGTRQEDYATDNSGEGSSQEYKLESREELDEAEDEEIKRYILEKIEEANKQLESQAPADQKRERKLKFKDELVDLEVPPLEDAGVYKTDLTGGDDVSSGLSQLRISNDVGQKSPSLSPRAGTDEDMTDGKILVEKDGKFELLRLCDIESQGFLPPVSVSVTDIETRHTSPKSSHYSSFPAVSQIKEIPPVGPGAHSFSPGEESTYFPKPPSDPKYRTNSAVNAARGLGKQKNAQRTQSANVSVRSSTYSVSPRQKELRKQLEQRNERLRKEEEERKRELEEQKRRENEIVFKAWLQKKKEQLQEEKRIRRAKQLEELSMQERNRDPEAAYNLWLKKKHREHMKERQIQLMRRQAEELAFFPRTEECDRAFKEWLRRKREEKRAAELAAKERVRQLRLEARRAKQMRNIHCI